MLNEVNYDITDTILNDKYSLIADILNIQRHNVNELSNHDKLSKLIYNFRNL